MKNDLAKYKVVHGLLLWALATWGFAHISGKHVLEFIFVEV